MAAWREEPIARHHDRQSFDCGEPTLNEFIRRSARQGHERGSAKTFVAVSTADESTIFGYYSLSPASLEYTRVPEIIRRGLARYDVPVFRLGRLAVDLRQQRQGLGGDLLLAAGRRCLRVANEVGGVALLIDAKNARVAEWYVSYGAVSLQDTPHSLLIPLSTFSAALDVAEQQ